MTKRRFSLLMSALSCGGICSIALFSVLQGPSSVSALMLSPSTPICTTVVTSPLLPLVITKPGLTVVTEPDQTYPVFGKNSTELTASIAACSPIREDNQRYGARTSYVLNWHYDLRSTGTGCVVSNPAVGLHLVSLYPKTDSLSPVVQNSWNTYQKNTRTHEQGHVALSQDYAKKLLAQLQITPSHMSCAAVAQKAHQLSAELDAKQTAYDLQTNHGERQGAVLN